MSKTTKTVIVTQYVEVTLDESKFTPEFMEEFREYMYDFESVEEHREHLAQMYACGLCDSYSYVEGYGNLEDMGVEFRLTLTVTELE